MIDHTDKSNETDQAEQWSACLAAVAESGDRQAFQQLFRKFAPLVKAFALRQSGGDFTGSLAEELVQETMIKVWQKAASFDARKASASTWIFTIARNTRIDLLRKTSRHHINRISSDEDDGFDDEEDVFNQLANQRTREHLRESMKSLPEEQEFILKKAYLEDKSHSEIAEELQLPLGTVKSRVRLALSKLRLSVDR